MNGDTLQRLASVLPDRYRLDRELGRGGMATVYLGRERSRMSIRAGVDHRR